MSNQPGLLDTHGPVEYAVGALIVLQAFTAHKFLTRWRKTWARPLFIAAVIILAALLATTTGALILVWTGTLYESDAVSPAFGSAIIAIGYFWIVFSCWAIILALITRTVKHRFPETASPARRQLLQLSATAAFAAPCAVAAFGILVERKQYRVHELDFPVPDLHPDFNNFRIVQVSDLHVSPFLSLKDAAHVIGIANDLNPHLALFTGDLITQFGDPLDAALNELRRLRGDNGVLACMGNHEEYIECRDYLEAEARRVGIEFLRHKSVTIRRGSGAINIAGVDYQRMGHRASYLKGTENLVASNIPNILLSHNPDVFPEAVKRGFRAVIGGHTHGGQVNVEILHQNVNPARFKTPYTSGLYRLNEASLFVSNGIGTIGIPMRIGAPPEIVLLRLQRA